MPEAFILWERVRSACKERPLLKVRLAGQSRTLLSAQVLASAQLHTCTAEPDPDQHLQNRPGTLQITKQEFYTTHD